MNQSGICRICGQRSKLAQAHLYPDSLYKHLQLYQPDKKGQGRIHMAKFTETVYAYNEDGLPTGLYDNSILCVPCDNLINTVCENKAKTLLFDPPRTIFNFTEGIGVFENLDYNVAKLFFLSIFLKASFSPRLDGIHLGRAIERRICQMLVQQDAGPPEELGIFFIHINDAGAYFSLLSHVRLLATRDNVRYSFLAGGLMVSLYPRRDAIPESVRASLLDPVKPLAIMKLEAGRAEESLDHFYETDRFSKSKQTRLA